MNDAIKGRSHSISVEQFATLAQGSGDPAVIGQLVAAERSKHLILLARVAELAQRGDHPDDRIAMAGSELLAVVQRQDMVAAAEVTSYPSVGAWALQVIRADDARPEARRSGLAAIAAAAAIRAGLDVEIEVPVINGAVLLPSLGIAGAAGSTALVATKTAEVRSGSGCVEMRAGAPGWQDLRPVTLGR
jgi:HEXXH motif-containing protein